MIKWKLAALLLIPMIAIACRSHTIMLNVTYASISGVEKGDRVIFQGNTAGRVKTVQFNRDGSYTLQLELDKGFSNAATNYSQFHVVDDPDRPGHKGVEIQLTQNGGTPLEDGATVAGASPAKDLGTRLQEELEAGIGFLKKQIDKFGRDIQAFPESREYKDLKKSLEDLAGEIERQEKDTREKLKREWLPRIQRELDDLRERLKQQGRENELAPLDREVERIRKI